MPSRWGRKLQAAVAKLFRRRAAPAPHTQAGQDSAAPEFAQTVSLEPEVPPLEVSEGNSDADWALWEKAVKEVDTPRHASAVPSAGRGESSAGGSSPPRSER